MTQTALCFDRPKPEELGFKRDSQTFRLYERILDGPVDNGEIIYRMRIANSTGRISDIRKALRPYLYDIKATADPMDRSKVTYRITG